MLWSLLILTWRLIMNKNLFLITTASLLLLSPMSQHVYGLDSMTDQGMDMTSKAPSMNVTITQDKTAKEDENLINAVKSSLSSDFASDLQNIDIKAEKGVVTLDGKVKSDAAKSAIESKVKSVAGVSKVVNNIEVQKDSATRNF